MMFSLIKLKIQMFGRFLSNMIIPNISVFIAWGIMTSLFTPLGWYPNKELSQLIPPITIYLLPLLIGYTGGKLISGNRGGLVASISTIGAIISTSVPMMLGAMIIGPISGWVIKYFDKKIENKIINGFEMLINNFSIAIISIILSIISFFTIGPFVEWLSNNLGYLINIILKYHLLPFLAVIIEPAKIFFLNNIINHGIFSPLGMQEILDKKSSIFFLIESNPGPGLGVLIAFFLFGKGGFSKSSGGAAFIEFLGGVHEVYFPYILMQPKLIISLVLGSMTGIFMLLFLNGGLVSAVSPGSILSILAMTPKGLYLVNIMSIFCSFFVSFIMSIILLNISIKKNNNIFSKSTDDTNNINVQNNFHSIYFKNIHNIIVACDAGMGSSAMGASILRKKIKNANLINISVSNSSISKLTKNIDLVITHQSLTERAKIYAPLSQHLSLKNFLNHKFYDDLVEELIKNNIFFKNHNASNNISSDVKELNNSFKLCEKNIFLNQYAQNKEEAIILIGQHLVNQGYVTSDYINSMLEREKITPTWLGESIALPHGTIKAKDSVLKTGIIFCQFPHGVHFGEEVDDIAYIVIGIAAKNNEHIQVVSSITNALDNKDTIKILSKTTDIKKVLSFFTITKK